MYRSFVKYAEKEIMKDIINELTFCLSGIYWNCPFPIIEGIDDEDIKKTIITKDENKIIDYSKRIAGKELLNSERQTILRQVKEQLEKYENLVNGNFDQQISRRAAFEIGKSSNKESFPPMPIENVDSKNILFFNLAFYIGKVFSEILEKNKEQANIIIRNIDNNDYDLYLMGHKISKMSLNDEIKPSKDTKKIFELVNKLSQDFEI